MPELLVCLTFDHDNASSMISRKLTSPTMISRGDFGIVAVPRILDLLHRLVDGVRKLPPVGDGDDNRWSHRGC